MKTNEESDFSFVIKNQTVSRAHRQSIYITSNGVVYIVNARQYNFHRAAFVSPSYGLRCAFTQRHLQRHFSLSLRVNAKGARFSRSYKTRSQRRGACGHVESPGASRCMDSAVACHFGDNWSPLLGSKAVKALLREGMWSHTHGTVDAWQVRNSRM